MSNSPTTTGNPREKTGKTGDSPPALRAPRKSKGHRWFDWPDVDTHAGRIALINLVVGLIIFGFAFGAVFYWMNRGGWIGWAETLVLCAWSGFFAGLVGHYSASLQSRRALLLGVVRVSETECRRLHDRATRNLSGAFWSRALIYALSAAVVQAVVMLLLSSLGEKAGYQRRAYLFYTALLPALSYAFISWRAVRFSAERMLLARRDDSCLNVTNRRYLWLHSVLPYALVSAAVGLVTVFARFRDEIGSAAGVPAESAAWHLALTALIVCLLIPAVSRFKTRVDMLSPIRFDGPAAGRRLPKYRFWAAPLVAALVWGGTYWLCGWLGAGHVDAFILIWAKTGMCLVLAGSTTALSVAGALRQQPHPYFELSRQVHQARQRFLRSGADERLI